MRLVKFANLTEKEKKIFNYIMSDIPKIKYKIEEIKKKSIELSDDFKNRLIGMHQEGLEYLLDAKISVSENVQINAMKANPKKNMMALVNSGIVPTENVLKSFFSNIEHYNLKKMVAFILENKINIPYEMKINLIEKDFYVFDVFASKEKISKKFFQDVIEKQPIYIEDMIKYKDKFDEDFLYDMIKIAVEKTPNCIDGLLRKGVKIDEELQELAINHQPYSLYIMLEHNLIPNENLQLNALLKYPYMVKKLSDVLEEQGKKVSKKILKELIRKNYRNFNYIPNPSEDIVDFYETMKDIGDDKDYADITNRSGKDKRKKTIIFDEMRKKDVFDDLLASFFFGNNKPTFEEVNKIMDIFEKAKKDVEKKLPNLMEDFPLCWEQEGPDTRAFVIDGYPGIAINPLGTIFNDSESRIYSVALHEIGHQLDENYDLTDVVFKDEDLMSILNDKQKWDYNLPQGYPNSQLYLESFADLFVFWFSRNNFRSSINFIGKEVFKYMDDLINDLDKITNKREDARYSDEVKSVKITIDRDYERIVNEMPFYDSSICEYILKNNCITNSDILFSIEKKPNDVVLAVSTNDDVVLRRMENGDFKNELHEFLSMSFKVNSVNIVFQKKPLNVVVLNIDKNRVFEAIKTKLTFGFYSTGFKIIQEFENKNIKINGDIVFTYDFVDNYVVINITQKNFNLDNEAKDIVLNNVDEFAVLNKFVDFEFSDKVLSNSLFQIKESESNSFNNTKYRLVKKT